MKSASATVGLLTILSAMMLFPVGVAADAPSTHYDIAAQLFPERGELRVEVAMTCVATEGGLDRFELLLNRGLQVESVSCDAGVKSFTFDRSQPSPNRYAPTSSPLIVELARPVEAGKSTVLHLTYAGTIEPDAYHTNLLTRDWVELALYAGWYPIYGKLGGTTSRVEVTVEEPYAVTGTGELSRSGDAWVLTQAQPTFDIVVISAPNLGVRRIGEERAGIDVWYRNLPKDQVDRIAADSRKMMASYESWLGQASARTLRIVFADRVSGGGYYRPGFMSLIWDDDYRGLVKYAAHEVAHFWWGRGSAATWEDWLNESFAEYSSLMLMREWYGEEVFQKYLDDCRQGSANTPPIWGLDRSDKSAQAVLYQKGPLLLNRLESEMGRENFRRFLATLVERKVSTTDQLRSTLEELTSKEVCTSFEQDLKR